MNLGTYTDTLSALDQALPVYFDNGRPAGRLDSWRGIYAELTLTPQSEYRPDEPHNVSDLLADALAADGGQFEGYKGGTYTMDRGTAVWADDYGECNYWAIAGIEVRDGRVVINRMNLADYR